MNIVKILGIIAIFAVGLTIFERWFNIFYLGRLYENVGLGIALLGFLVPIAVGAGCVYLSVRLYKA